jgi:hypothetical protein
MFSGRIGQTFKADLSASVRGRSSWSSGRLNVINQEGLAENSAVRWWDFGPIFVIL